mmetsp:Transcript_22449/g.40520  ORF Transcript_22449/g.40520 Transcript_22449/m.40520 type:complete len:117 (-) Transcript_22449:886-1236(-)
MFLIFSTVLYQQTCKKEQRSYLQFTIQVKLSSRFHMFSVMKRMTGCHCASPRSHVLLVLPSRGKRPKTDLVWLTVKLGKCKHRSRAARACLHHPQSGRRNSGTRRTFQAMGSEGHC